MMQLGCSKASITAAKGVSAVRQLYVDTLAADPAPADDVAPTVDDSEEEVKATMLLCVLCVQTDLVCVHGRGNMR